ncbi:hypothetical protein [Actinokineospora bangkokensis]|uniref:Uncharacterized protein n=1 Tax=Actinokineospora bangkokensis TaxID=1193682 RepID=A0A1Q9LHZ0_9PSEU|nr:hypothetical protein [Actinokineospora bangkokensis]OLR91651.1 hypothetical protein BJP25_26240 [Actinokineospora bangkokensis]
MSRPGFPALGFDPTPGDPGTVQAVLLSMASAQQAIATTLPRLEEAAKVTDDADWGGSAAEEFSDHGDDLPMGLGKGGEAIGKAVEALSAWARVMVPNQTRADELEKRAKDLKKQVKAASEAVRDAAGAIPRDTSNPHYGARYDDFLSATKAAADLDARLAKVVDDAKRLQAKHLREANAAADAIRSGPDDAFTPENDTWYVQAFDGTAKAADWVSLATGTVAAGLAATGIGLPAAAVLETASTTSGAVGSLAALGQQLSGSRNAQGWAGTLIGLGTSVIPGGGTAAAAVRSGTRAAAKGGSRQALKQVAKDVREALGSGGAPGVVNTVKEMRERGIEGKVRKDLIDSGREAAKRQGLTDDLSKLPLAERRDALLGLGAAEKQREAVVSSIDNTTKLAEKAGVELDDGQKARLDALKLALNPTPKAVDDAITGKITDRLKGE